MPAQGPGDGLGRPGGDPPLLLFFPREGAAEHEVGSEAAGDRPVARACELSRLQQALLSGFDFLPAEAFGERLAEFLRQRPFSPRPVLRRVDGEGPYPPTPAAAAG